MRRSRDGLYALFGRTFTGRYLLVILAPRGEHAYQVVVARDQTSEERRADRAQRTEATVSNLTEEQQRFVDLVDAGESIWEETEPVAEQEVPAREPLNKLIAVRLTQEQWTMLYCVAREMGIGPATLSRMWILERLKPLYNALERDRQGWRHWRSRNPDLDEAIYRRMLAGEPVADPTGAVYHRLKDEGYEVGWDREEGRGYVVLGRRDEKVPG